MKLSTIQSSLLHCLFLAIVAHFSLFSPKAFAEDWTFTVAPYLGFPAAEGESSLSFVDEADIDVGHGDTFSNIRPHALFQGELFHRSGLGWIGNVAYTDLENSLNDPDGFFSFKGNIVQTTLEAYMAYRFETLVGPFDVYGGGRWWFLELQASGQDERGSFLQEEDYTWFDPVAGFRFFPAITDSVRFSVQADYGVGGDSESTMSSSIGLLFRQSEDFSFSLLYRALWIDYEDTESISDRFTYDSVTHGPLFGFIVRL